MAPQVPRGSGLVFIRPQVGSEGFAREAPFRFGQDDHREQHGAEPTYADGDCRSIDLKRRNAEQANAKRRRDVGTR
jgi:hypothetical protein